MSTRSSQDRPFRARTLALVAGVLVVSLAARRQQPPAPPAAAALATTATPDSAPGDRVAPADSLAPDTTALAAATPAAAAPASAPVAAPTAWPVDPVTGQTLINGEPVVGQVFIMQKTDGTKKIETVAMALAGEPPAPAPAVVGTTRAAAPTHTRRMRGVMIQATLWGQDHKRSAVERRFYRATTATP